MKRLNWVGVVFGIVAALQVGSAFGEDVFVINLQAGKLQYAADDGITLNP